MEKPRPDPDALLQAAAREGRGRLKMFLGAAPGVGKTWEMLAAAQREHAHGRDVLIGVVETHGRAETAAQIGALDILPRKSIAYRGQVLEEFDADAALARHPGLLLVDELAHTNAPGSRHHKRWEDVAELLEAGIDIWATLNIQHLESLNDDIARITGVRVAETLPDRVMEMADDIEFIDITPAELRTRLKDGKIYPAATAARALENFFREGNLAALREIGLRRAAQRVDQDVQDYMRQHAVAGPWPAGDRVLALVSRDAGAEAVVRQAKRLSDALRAPWIALHFERSDSVDDGIPALDMASQLGASVEIRASGDLVATILELAHAQNVTHLVIGRGKPGLLRRITGRTLAGTLVRAGPEFTLHVVPMGGKPTPARTASDLPRSWLPWALSSLPVAAITGAGELFAQWLDHEALGMLFLAAVVGTASLWGLAIAVYTAALAFLCWNFFFIPPIHQFTIEQPRDVIAVLVFLTVAVITGWMASRVRRAAEASQGRIESLRRITAFSRRLGAPATEADLLEEVARLAADIASPALMLMTEGEDLNIRAAFPRHVDTMDEGSWAAARWAASRSEQAGRGTATLPGAVWRFFPVRTVRAGFGVLGVRPDEALGQGEAQALLSLADQAAAALERVRLTASAARTEAQAETQKLRTALLNSLSHDLRTPLTGIRGAAGSLRTAWDSLSGPARLDLLASIEQDTVRMTRFLSNIMDMTRLETGEVAPRLEVVALPDLVALATDRVPGLPQVATDIPADLPLVQADPALLEQVLVNILENAAKYGPPAGLVRISAWYSGGSSIPASTPLASGPASSSPAALSPPALSPPALSQAMGRRAADAASGRVHIAVADEGPGISAADLPHVFDSFYRARRGDRTVPGTGLGLAIARGLVEAMGGTIAARSPRPDAPRNGAPGTIIDITLHVVRGGVST
jgi:two-component system sensor histidine kinase KdpD